MPFTFAHPAIVFPFKYLPKRMYSWTALIIGSMVPDFQAFIHLGGDKKLSHSWIGMFTYDFPVGIILMILFHLIVRNGLVLNLPRFLRNRLVPYTKLSSYQYFRGRIAIIIISLLIGIFTHLVWDRITHTDTYTYTQRAGIDLTGEQNAKLRVLLQWGCSIAGTIIIIWQLMILPVFRKEKQAFYWPSYWLIVIVTIIIVYAIRLQYPHVGDDMINTSVGSFLLGIVIASIAYNIKRDKRVWLQ